MAPFDTLTLPLDVGPALASSGGRSGPVVTYHPHVALWEGLDGLLTDLITRSGAVDIAELGGGANPSIDVVTAAGRADTFTVVDISPAELDKSGVEVRTVQADLAQPGLDLGGSFDLVFSRMLAEHVPSGRAFHENCFASLRPGGLAVHFSPVVSSLPFLANRLLPDGLSDKIVLSIWPERSGEGQHGKFPAPYSWCAGPTERHLARFRSVGFEPVAFFVGFGHGYYEKVPPLRLAERAKTRFLLRHPKPGLASYVISVLRRPEADEG
ncbi:MAG TPA: methyltransferase domain-containing protein [Acidimicrobiales bacterium]|nr:methyltransferase domain-containing protein [Acidimicrobiales bacterium]